MGRQVGRLRETERSHSSLDWLVTAPQCMLGEEERFQVIWGKWHHLFFFLPGIGGKHDKCHAWIMPRSGAGEPAPH